MESRRREQLRIVSVGRAVLLVVSLAAAGTLGCDDSVEVESGSPSAGGGSGTSTGPGSSGTTGPGGAGVGGTSTGGAGTAGDGTTSTTSTTTTTTGIPPGCIDDSDCNFIKPYCEAETGTCVACLIDPYDICLTGTYCAKTPTGNACVPGCNDDADCNAGPEPDVFTCDLMAHQCLGCSADDHCPPGSICDAATNQCTPGCSAEHPCAIEPDCCWSTCTDLLSDVANCGTCGNICQVDLPNGTGMCSLGVCKLSCNIIGFVDCNKVVEDGCEVDVGSDPDNCGGCGNKCKTGPNVLTACVAKQCASTCEPGFADCDGIDSNGCEVDLTSDPGNCGGCGNKCPDGPNMQALCAAGACTWLCAPGFADCDGDASNGCEADLFFDPTNCGGCGNVCAGPGACDAWCLYGACGAGGCACPFADCNVDPADGCEADTSTDPSHCGSCQTACGAGQVCTAGVCL